MLKNRIVLFIVAIVALAVMTGGGFAIGFKLGQEFPQNLIVTGATNIDPEKPIGADFATFWQAWQIINDEYLKNKDVSAQRKVYGAIEGLVRSLNDPNSEFFSPQENKKFQQDIQGNFGGIGAEIGIRKEKLVVVAPLEDTPASRAGLKPGDHILKVNATSTEGLSVREAVSIIRGDVGTDVVLTILRSDWDKPKEFTLTRTTIVVPTLTAAIKENILHLKLQSFNANTIGLLHEAIVNGLNKGMRGMVLDIRNNPGGYLSVAIDVSGYFFKPGTLVVTESGTGDGNKEFRANGNARLANIPIVVLMNGGSASASEILAGALRDIRNIKLIGEKSFGKGTVQQLETLKDNSSLKITVANWVLPSGKILEGEGLSPDIEVKLTDEDIEKERDPQLERAFEVLKSELTARSR